MSKTSGPSRLDSLIDDAPLSPEAIMASPGKAALVKAIEEEKAKREREEFAKTAPPDFVLCHWCGGGSCLDGGGCVACSDARDKARRAIRYWENYRPLIDLSGGE